MYIFIARIETSHTDDLGIYLDQKYIIWIIINCKVTKNRILFSELIYLRR